MAARALESLIASKGRESAVAEFRRTIAGNERYRVEENELVALNPANDNGTRAPGRKEVSLFYPW